MNVNPNRGVPLGLSVDRDSMLHAGNCVREIAIRHGVLDPFSLPDMPLTAVWQEVLIKLNTPFPNSVGREATKNFFDDLQILAEDVQLQLNDRSSIQAYLRERLPQNFSRMAPFVWHQLKLSEPKFLAFRQRLESRDAVNPHVSQIRQFEALPNKDVVKRLNSYFDKPSPHMVAYAIHSAIKAIKPLPQQGLDSVLMQLLKKIGDSGLPHHVQAKLMGELIAKMTPLDGSKMSRVQKAVMHCLADIAMQKPGDELLGKHLLAAWLLLPPQPTRNNLEDSVADIMSVMKRLSKAGFPCAALALRKTAAEQISHSLGARRAASGNVNAALHSFILNTAVAMFAHPQPGRVFAALFGEICKALAVAECKIYGVIELSFKSLLPIAVKSEGIFHLEKWMDNSGQNWLQWWKGLSVELEPKEWGEILRRADADQLPNVLIGIRNIADSALRTTLLQEFQTCGSAEGLPRDHVVWQVINKFDRGDFLLSPEECVALENFAGEAVQFLNHEVRSFHPEEAVDFSVDVSHEQQATRPAGNFLLRKRGRSDDFQVVTQSMVRAILDSAFERELSELWQSGTLFNEEIKKALRRSLADLSLSDSLFETAWGRFSGKPLTNAQTFIADFSDGFPSDA